MSVAEDVSSFLGSVFVSSVLAETRDYRRIARDAICEAGYKPVLRLLPTCYAPLLRTLWSFRNVTLASLSV